jgi:tetratricopeptide (TPR) repeat protein
MEDSSFQWFGRALPLVLQEDLATSPRMVLAFATDDSGAYQLQANDVIRTTVEDRAGRIRVQAVMTDLATQKNRSVIEVESNSAADFLVAANQIAKRLDSSARNFSTANLNALKTFTTAVESPEGQKRTEALIDAISADPSFGLAHIVLLETTGRSGPPVDAKTFSPLDQVRWNALWARYSHALLQDQATLQAAVLNVAPNSVDALATLGSLRFLEGKSEEGKRLLSKAISLSPANINLELQLAQGLIAARRYAEATHILRSLGGNPASLPALAISTLLEGRTEEASKVFESFLGLLAPGSPAVAFLRAQWKAISSGKVSSARVDIPAAQESPASKGYTLFLNSQYDEASRVWQSVVNQTGDTDLRARAMLAASLEHTGRAAEAHKILVQPFVPEFGDPYASVAFNEMRHLLNRM